MIPPAPLPPEPEPPHDVRAVVFDLDGTLIDSYEAIAASLSHALVAMGEPPIDVARVRGMVGRGLETLIERALGATATSERVREGVGHFRRRYDEVCVGATRLLPGVAGTLADLHARGYRMAVATNKPSYFATRLLDALAAGRFLETVIGPDLVTHHKPHPEMVLTALERLVTPPSRALYVGDMEVDVETARAAGVRVAVVPTGSRTLDELRGAGADWVLPSFPALLDLLPGPR